MELASSEKGGPHSANYPYSRNCVSQDNLMTQKQTVVWQCVSVHCCNASSISQQTLPPAQEMKCAVALVFLSVIYVFADTFAFGSALPSRSNGSPIRSRLNLTPYIADGKIKKARRLAAVNYRRFKSDVPSYSGFFNVNKQFNSHLFFWFFPAEYDYENAPVLLWLQGGPGFSSLFGLFNEVGPFSVAEDNVTLVMNPYSWHKNHSLVFIDNPVGTGFSFTDFDEGLATNQSQIAEELYCALIQFFALFSELRSLPFFIAGESYAGKYIPSLSYTIHKRNPAAEHKINLQGIAVGNGWTDPVSMLDRSSFLYQVGLVDRKTRDEMHNMEQKTVQLIKSHDYEEATRMESKLFEYFRNHTKYDNIYNVLLERERDTEDRFAIFVDRNKVRKALHVGDTQFSHKNDSVSSKLFLDIMQSVRSWLEELLEHYRVLYYSGQLDIIVAYTLSLNMYNALQFSAAEEYRNASRWPWYVDGQLAGYVKTAGKFTEVLVRNAGHSVPIDQPAWALDLITTFTRDKCLNRQNSHQ